MRTETYNVDAASDRRRRENVPRHILCFFIGNAAKYVGCIRQRKEKQWN